MLYDTVFYKINFKKLHFRFTGTRLQCCPLSQNKGSMVNSNIQYGAEKFMLLPLGGACNSCSSVSVELKHYHTSCVLVYAGFVLYV